jgi:hypothetical protein
MYNRKSLAALLLLTGAGIVIACGPEFPAQLLDDRAATLRATPANAFSYETARLVDASDALRAREAYELPDGSYLQNALPEDRDPALTPAQRTTARAMRAQADGDRAYALGADLPEAVRHPCRPRSAGHRPPAGAGARPLPRHSPVAGAAGRATQRLGRLYAGRNRGRDRVSH